MELPKRDGPRAVCGTQCERLSACVCYRGNTETFHTALSWWWGFMSVCSPACSFPWGWPTTRWSGRACGGSWAVWLAARPSPCGRRAATLWNLLFRYRLNWKHSVFLCCLSEVVVVQVPRNMFLWLLLTPTLFFQHTMSVDSRNSTIFPSRGALLRLSQVASLQTKLISTLEKALFF